MYEEKNPLLVCLIGLMIGNKILLPLSEEDVKRVIPTDLIMLKNFNSDKLVFKEFVMKEEGNRLKIVEVIE
jgi:hypothetical protein